MGADQTIDWAATAASVLDWWQEAGVDCLVDDERCDWLAAPALPAPALPATALPATALSSGGLPGVAVAAPPLSVMPDTIEAFAAWRMGSDAPEAGWPGRRLGAEGDPAAEVAIVTDWPEREDLAAGRLLSGNEGRLLDRMLAAIGLLREGVYLVPVATARPPAGRVDAATAGRLAEATLRQIELSGARRVLLMGNAASRAVLAMDCTIARESVHAINHSGGPLRVVASLHPRLLLQRPVAKADAWRDLIRLMGDGE